MQPPQHYIQSLIEEIMCVTEEALQASASSVLLVDTEEEELSFRFVHGPAEGILREAALGTDTGIVGWVARHREPLIVNDASSDARFCGDMDEITGFSTRAIICAPLVARGRLLGVIEVLNKTDGSDFDEHDLHTLVAVARTAAAAIELKLAEEAVRDSEERLVNSLGDTQLKLSEPPPPGH